MKVTEVRIKLTGETDDRLLAFCSVTFDDCFVVRDLKVIGGPTGPFVAMPSRKLTGHCPKCRAKNNLRCNFCNQCGTDLSRENSFQGRDSHTRLYADIAHPINAECREMIQQNVIEEFNQEMQRSTLPGYQSRYDEEYDAGDDSGHPAPSRHPREKNPNDSKARKIRKAKNETGSSPGKGSGEIDDRGADASPESEAGSELAEVIEDAKPLTASSSNVRRAASKPTSGNPAKKFRADKAKSGKPTGPHQQPENAEEPSKPNDKRDNFGFGILD